MKIGDLVLHKTTTDLNRDKYGIVLKVYDYRFDHLQDEGSKWRPMVSVQWFHIPTMMEHQQDRLKVISGNRLYCKAARQPEY